MNAPTFLDFIRTIRWVRYAGTAPDFEALTRLEDLGYVTVVVGTRVAYELTPEGLEIYDQTRAVII
jgi:hypothetical protein